MSQSNSATVIKTDYAILFAAPHLILAIILAIHTFLLNWRPSIKLSLLVRKRCFTSFECPWFQCLSRLALSEAHVTILTSCLTSQYRSEEAPGDLAAPFLRALKTDAEGETPVCPFLEQPNTVPGLPAQGELIHAWFPFCMHLLWYQTHTPFYYIVHSIRCIYEIQYRFQGYST